MAEMDYKSPNEGVNTLRKAFMKKLELEFATGRKKRNCNSSFRWREKNNLENVGVK